METRVIKGILFDAFGTLCRIENPQLPYRLIMKKWENGAADCYQAIMTQDLPMATFAEEAGLAQDEIALLEAKVAEEIRSMRLFPEVAPTLQALREHGFKIAVVSNLATPYGPPIFELLPFEPDVRALSYEVGARKPEEAIYRHAWESLGCAPAELLMIGDSFQNDYQRPVELGLRAIWLNRTQSTAQGEQKHVVSSIEDVLERVGIGLT